MASLDTVPGLTWFQHLRITLASGTSQFWRPRPRVLPGAPQTETDETRRAFVREMMDLHPEAFAHENDIRSLFGCCPGGY